MRFDHFIGEQTARKALGTRGEIERAMRFLFCGRMERDQLLFQDLRSNASKDLPCSLAIGNVLEERQDGAHLVGSRLLHGVELPPTILRRDSRPGMCDAMLVQQSDDGRRGLGESE